ncbi:uncharacterized protein LOC119331302 isoform X2 [Triticum dicoccoides]|uniref:uncharacterized protein LOC119331302 isoform X2 n=1 Tax=Triticum dicoccoides TaxID=85692 RepID=UPI0018910B93|nr:uncharacterized protein LOC119331302 isoform X2 [Triticum dicoccoides]
MDGHINLGHANSYILSQRKTLNQPQEEAVKAAKRELPRSPKQPWMLRVQGVQGRFGVVPSQASAIPHLSRRSASRLFSSVAGRFPRRYRKQSSNNSVQQQQHLQATERIDLENKGNFRRTKNSLEMLQ